MGQPDSISGLGEAEWLDVLNADGLLSQSHYAENITRLRLHLDAHELLFAYHEDFHTQPMIELARIETFLGVSAHVYDDAKANKIFAASPRLAMPDTFRSVAQPIMDREFEALDRLAIAIPASWTNPNQVSHDTPESAPAAALAPA